MHNLDFARELLESVRSSVGETARSPRPRSSTAGSERELVSAGPQAPAIIGLLVSNECSHSDDDDAILAAQQMMLEAGADDVILKSGTKHELRASIAMAAARVRICRHKSARGRERQNRVIQELSQALEAQTAQMAEQREEPPQGMFWQAVHQIFQGFPKLSTSLPEKTGAGVRMGKLNLSGTLGSGTFGSVCTAVNAQTQEMEAVKIVDKKNLFEIESVMILWHEMRCLAGLKHANIVGFLGAMHGPNYVCIRMEHAGDTSLFRAQRLAGGKFSREVAHAVQLQLASAVAYCHGQKVAHRDLKPENMSLVDNQVLKLLDFGSASPTTKACSEIEGTMPFIAPEVQESSAANPYCAAGADIWSSGVILLEMLCGIGKMDRMLGWCRNLRPCPRRADEIRAFFRDRGVILRSLEQDLGRVENSLCEMFANMLRPDPASRWRASEVLNSQWLQSSSTGSTCVTPASMSGSSSD